MKLDRQQYQQLLARKSPPSPLWKDCLKAFLFGGAICAVGEAVLTFWQTRGLDTTDASTATSITMVFLGALLTCLHLYEKLAKHAGAGTIVPITGFANSIVSPAMEFKSEGLVLGLGAKLFVIAGPVLVYGIAASVVYGLVLVCTGGGGAA
ncbi:MAG: stage V sporulation protein AC [Eubacteriales bacterium]|nr:stage V sporulation protein AC [Eubacteriales bacterium]